MKLYYKSEGGIGYFPGLNKPFVIDSANLTASEAEELQHLVKAVSGLKLPARKAAHRPGAADYKQYVITIEEGKKQTTLHFTDLQSEPALQDLITYIQEQRKKLRTDNA